MDCYPCATTAMQIKEDVCSSKQQQQQQQQHLISYLSSEGLLISNDLEAQGIPSELHQLVDLVVFNESIAVGVGESDSAGGLPAGEPAVDAANGAPKLLAADAAVLVGVEPLQPFLELVHRHLPAHRPRCRHWSLLDGHPTSR